ncbi:MAG: acyltransferase [Acetobacteraceae bacterium]
MRGGFSCYLDLIRVTAAGVVFLHHLAFDFGCYGSASPGCAALTMLVPFHAGHSAVVAFFVLSGYVITVVATERERSLRDFALARAARIYSVAVPTLALVMGIDLLSYLQAEPDAYPAYQYASVWKYLPLILGFATDHWFLAENAFSLGAWWSVAYEVWYYILFAACFFLRGWRRWAATGLVGLAMGPKLLALLPLWLLGSFVYVLHCRGTRVRAALPVFVLTLVAMAVLLLSSAVLPLDAWTDALSGGWISRRLRFSRWFAGDLAFALLFALNLYAARSLRLEFGPLARPIRMLAGYTFTFYMIHGPVLKLIARHLDDRMPVVALGTILFTFAFGRTTEQQKGRLRRLLERAVPRPSGLAA